MNPTSTYTIAYTAQGFLCPVQQYLTNYGNHRDRDAWTDDWQKRLILTDEVDATAIAAVLRDRYPTRRIQAICYCPGQIRRAL